jgi:Ankyrin repeats (3 copies)
MSESDLDSLYKRASEQDGAHPSAAVRQAILEHARRVAEQTAQQPAAAAEDQLYSGERGGNDRPTPSRWSRWVARWPQMRWQIAVPLASAALAVILLQPQLRSSLPAPAQLQKSAPSAATADRVAPVVPKPINIPPPLTARAHSAPEPFPANSSANQSASSGAPAAPPAMTLPAPAPPAPVPSASEAPSANLASRADLATAQAVAPAARMRSVPSAAPLAERQERAQVQSYAAEATALSQSELLHEAAARGDAARVRSLLQLSAVPIDGRDASGRTALMLAVLHGHEAVVRALLERGADPNIADAAGDTPLAVARQQQQHQQPIVDELLRSGAR